MHILCKWLRLWSKAADDRWSGTDPTADAVSSAPDRVTTAMNQEGTVDVSAASGVLKLSLIHI